MYLLIAGEVAHTHLRSYLVLLNKRTAHFYYHLIVDALEYTVSFNWKILLILLQISVVDHDHLQLLVLLHHRVRFESQAVIYIIS
jgi:hypothetical protein